MRTHHLSRRGFLQVGTAGLCGLSLVTALRRSEMAAAAESAPQARNVIMIFLTGGPATIDMWDMKPNAPEIVRGEFQPRDTSVPGLQICEHMPRLAAAIHHATLVRSLTHTIAEHGQGATYVMTGNRPTPASEYPSLGSLCANLVGSSEGTPAYLTIGTVPAAGAGDLGASLNPFEVALDSPRSPEKQEVLGLPAGFTADDLKRRQSVLVQLDRRMQRLQSAELPRQLDRFQQQALEILRSDKINRALDVTQELPPTRDSYGASAFGRSALAARRLVEAGARYVTIGFGDWDTHANNFSRLRTTLLPELDQGLAALLTDLAARGLLDDTIVYCTGEFGRTPGVNATAGRDHWARSMTALIAGGGFHRGFVYGATDKDGQEPTDLACSPDDLGASIFRQLGFPPTHQVATRSGRPVQLFRSGRVIDELAG